MSRSLSPDDFKDSKDNRRAEARTAVRRRIDLLPCQATKDWKFISAELTDCSLHGLGLLVPGPMIVGQQFLVKLRTPKGIRMLLYTVHNCGPAEKARHRIGARFSGFAAQEFDEDLNTILEALVRGE